MKTKLSNLADIAVKILAVAGLLISIELCIVYFNANFNQNAVPSFCAINEVFDCDAVAETTYSRLLGVPLSLWGAGFYALILFILFFPFQKFDFFKDFKNPRSYIFSLTSFSLIESAVMAYISSFVIDKICILCHILYFINIGLFLFTYRRNLIFMSYKNTLIDIKNILSNRKWLVIFIFCLIAGITSLVLINIYQPFEPVNAQSLFAKDKKEVKEKRKNIGNTLGSPEARLVIREFTDFECPYCSMSNETMLQLTEEFPDIRVEHYDYPLNKACNSVVGFTMHENACIASYYAKAAKKQGKFWDMATLLFENQQDLSEENILKLAKSLNLDIEQLKKDAYSKEVKQEVQDDVKTAAEFGIKGTPSYVIGIKKYEGMMPYEDMKEKIIENL